MAEDKKLPVAVSSDDQLTGDTSAPGAISGHLLPSGTSDKPLPEPTEAYTQTMAAFLDKSLETRRFFRPKLLALLIAIGWGGLIAFLLISAESKENLSTVEDLKIFLIKAGIVTFLAVLLGILVWIFGDKDGDT